MSEANAPRPVVPAVQANPEPIDPATPAVNSAEAVYFDASLLDDLSPATQTIAAEGTTATHVEAIAALSEQLQQAAAPPDLADLVSLIQELNQCNGLLLERVSQLESALECSQNALKHQIERSHDPHWHSPDNDEIHAELWDEPQLGNLPLSARDAAVVLETASTQEQLLSLFNQLEFAQQTNHRQQVLVETLTEQLDNGQERIANLEREAASLQQRYSEQSQLLTQVELVNRDLQARLQRQQRYTLQFKAALEKCLEVPHPQAEADASPISTEEPIAFPKAQRIQPWTSPAAANASRLAWMKTYLDAFPADALESEAVAVEPAAEADRSETSASADLASASPAIAQPDYLAAKTKASKSKLGAIALPTFSPPVIPSAPAPEPASEPAFEPASPKLSPAISYALTDKTVESSPVLAEKIDAAVQPLVDLLAQAMIGQSHAPTDPALAQLPIDPAAAQSNSPLSPSIDPSLPPMMESSAAEALLQSTMADAEEALWQDLARLIDSSTEDAVKASLSGDFKAFESLNFEAMSTAIPAMSPSPDLSEPIVAEPPVDESNSPSILVHPLRSPKKRQSLGMVELPSFL